jgi:hypothetical protein
LIVIIALALVTLVTAPHPAGEAVVHDMVQVRVCVPAANVVNPAADAAGRVTLPLVVVVEVGLPVVKV